MMLKPKNVLLILATLSTGLNVHPSNAHAGHGNIVRGRCADDQANAREQVAGRNAWCVKCGYAEQEEADWFTAHDRYTTFTNLDAPWDANAACVTGAIVLAECKLAGCYTPGQRVMFGGDYVAIDQAASEAFTPTITSLRPQWFMEDDLSWVEEPIESFILGDESKPVLRITAENGLSVEVTDNHPMVDAAGNVLPAAEVKKETRLLTEGGPVTVVSVTSRSYKGKVWNVQPESLRTEANIHLAEGFVTGSVRFQDEWAEDETRLRLRRRINSNPF